MNSEIKTENVGPKESELKSLSEKDQKKIKNVIIVDNMSDNIEEDADKKLKAIENEIFKRRPAYPWERNKKTILKRRAPLKVSNFALEPVQIVGRSISAGGYGGNENYSTIGGTDIAGVTDSFNGSGAPISGRAQYGKHGTLKFSDKYKDGPLIFVVGGIAVDDANLGKKSWYPGDYQNKGKDGKTKEGYVWVNGFNNLNNFHVYNCKTSGDASQGWSECLSLLSAQKVNITKKIIVGFSDGASKMHQTFLKESSANFSVIHIIGAWMPNPTDADKHTTMIKSLKEAGRVFYFQQGGLDSATEGATVDNKKKIGVLLPQSNIINTQDHMDGLKKSSAWIKQNIKLEGKTTISQGGKSIQITISSGGALTLKDSAKFKTDTGAFATTTATGTGYAAGGGSTIIDRKWHVHGWPYKMFPPAYQLKLKGNSAKTSMKTVTSKPTGYPNGRLPNNKLSLVPGEGKRTNLNEYTDLMHIDIINGYLAMRNAAQKDGITLHYSNCYRPFNKQVSLWRANPNPDKVARVYYENGKPVRTTSNHGNAKAIDVGGDNRQKWINMNGDKFGWYWGDALSEDWHFVYCL